MPVTLYLDRNIYPIDPANEVWIRYVSVSKSIDEEDPEKNSRETPEEN